MRAARMCSTWSGVMSWCLSWPKTRTVCRSLDVAKESASDMRPCTGMLCAVSVDFRMVASVPLLALTLASTSTLGWAL
eukprot:12016989-Alexandrium_andersonii.AAC.1